MTPEHATAKQAENIDDMSDAEKKHVPLVHVEGDPSPGESFPVTVWVGEQLAHPMEADHHIEYVELYLDDTLVARCDLSWQHATPKVTFMVKADGPGTLRAYERCNLHGDWTYSLPLEL